VFQTRISALSLDALLVRLAFGVFSALELGAAAAGFSAKAVGTKTDGPVLGHLADCVFAAGGLSLVARTLALAVDAGAVVGTVVVVAAAKRTHSVLAELTLRTALVVTALGAAATVRCARLSAVAVLDARAAFGAEAVFTV